MTIPDLRVRAVNATEFMDDPGCDPAMLTNTYAQFPLVNAVVSRWRRIYRQRIRPLLSATTPSSLLDIGAGGADVPTALLRWARRDGLWLTVTATDPDERAYAYAYAATMDPKPGWRLLQADSADLVAAGERYDVVISNHVLHHLSSPELQRLLTDSEALCRRRVIHADIERSRAAYAAFALGTLPFTPLLRRSYIRDDGLTSIRRSYTRDELAAVLPPRWRVAPQVPYQLLLMYEN